MIGGAYPNSSAMTTSTFLRKGDLARGGMKHVNMAASAAILEAGGAKHAAASLLFRGLPLPILRQMHQRRMKNEAHPKSSRKTSIAKTRARRPTYTAVPKGSCTSPLPEQAGTIWGE